MKRIINEQLPVSDVNPLHVRTFDYKYFTYPWHCHNEFEIMFVETGRGKCMVGDTVTDYTDGTLFLFGHNIPHCMQSAPCYHNENALRVKGVIIQFEKEFMQYAFSHYRQFCQIQQLLDTSAQGICLHLADKQAIRSSLQKMSRTKGVSQIALFLSLLQAIAEQTDKRPCASPAYRPRTTDYQDEKMAKIMNYLQYSYTSPFKLEEMAAYIAMNPSALCRYFKKHTGKTLLQCITDMRIGYACKLLQSDAPSIAFVAEACGFESFSHFNRSFKRITGMQPTLYRLHLQEATLLPKEL